MPMFASASWKKHAKIAISVSGYLPHIFQQGFSSLS